MNSWARQFMLDPEVIFLNHGSFGACPRPIFQEYQRYQRQLERQPVQFLDRDLGKNLRKARCALGSFLHADPNNLVFIPNATFGVNAVARSLELGPEDEVVISTHEYGACQNIWDFLSQKAGFTVRRADIPLPLPDPEEIIQLIWNQVNSQTKLIFLSQITSPTAVELPVDQICRQARQEQILTLIDGAHAPGQINLDLQEIGADFYTGNCHKWLLAPKGAGFLYVRPEHHHWMKPLIISWGWGENCPYESDSQLLQMLEWWGTKDPSAYLTVPRAIEFQKRHDWQSIRDRSRNLLLDILPELEKITGLPSIYGKQPNAYTQMAAVELPVSFHPEQLQPWLYREKSIEIPVTSWNKRWFLRISVQGYNTREDLEELFSALRDWKKIKNV